MELQMRNSFRALQTISLGALLLGCGNIFGPSAEEIAAQEAKAKAEETARLRAQMDEKVARFLDAAKRLESDPAFTQEDLKAARADLAAVTALLNEHPEIAKGKPVEVGAALAELRDFVDGIKIGEVDVDARSGAQTGERIDNGYRVRLDVISGEWTASRGSPQWPPNPGTGYPNYAPGWMSPDYRNCRGADMGALVGRAGRTCFKAGGWYEFNGSADTLWFSMNDSMPDDNSGLLKVRWRLQTRTLDVNKLQRLVGADG